MSGQFRPPNTPRRAKDKAMQTKTTETTETVIQLDTENPVTIQTPRGPLTLRWCEYANGMQVTSDTWIQAGGSCWNTDADKNTTSELVLVQTESSIRNNRPND